MQNTCEWCGTTFKAYSSWTLYCSDRCRHEKENQEKNKDNQRRYEEEQRSQNVRLTCFYCGQSFISKYGYKNSNFCSEECYDRY